MYLVLRSIAASIILFLCSDLLQELGKLNLAGILDNGLGLLTRLPALRTNPCFTICSIEHLTVSGLQDEIDSSNIGFDTLNGFIDDFDPFLGLSAVKDCVQQDCAPCHARVQVSLSAWLSAT